MKSANILLCWTKVSLWWLLHQLFPYWQNSFVFLHVFSKLFFANFPYLWTPFFGMIVRKKMILLIASRCVLFCLVTNKWVRVEIEADTKSCGKLLKRYNQLSIVKGLQGFKKTHHCTGGPRLVRFLGFWKNHTMQNSYYLVSTTYPISTSTNFNT